MHFRQTYRAERKRTQKFNFVAGRTNQLEASTTDIRDECRFVAGKAVGGRSVGECGFFIWTYYAKWNFERLSSMHKLGAIRCFADRCSRDSADATNLESVTGSSHSSEDLEGAAHRFVAQPADGSECRPQAWLVFGFVDGGQAAISAELGDCEEDRVRPDIDGCKPLGHQFPADALLSLTSPPSSEWCLIERPSTRNTTSSPMLVARSATRSRFRLTRNSSIPEPMVWGSSIMCVSRIRNTDRCRASTLSSRRQTSRPASASPRMNASNA